jgi:hypothetical protein
MQIGHSAAFYGSARQLNCAAPRKKLQRVVVRDHRQRIGCRESGRGEVGDFFFHHAIAAKRPVAAEYDLILRHDAAAKVSGHKPKIVT